MVVKTSQITNGTQMETEMVETGEVSLDLPQPSTWDSPHASTSHTPDILARNHRPEETWKERI